MASPTVSKYDELMARNKKVAQTHPGAPFILADIPKDSMPSIPILVVTCSDARCDPNNFLSPEPLEMIIFRNQGGRVQNILPDIISTDTLVRFQQIWVIHHNDCGASIVAEEDVRSAVGKLPGVEPKTLEAMFLPPFTDFEKSVRDDLTFLRSTPFLRKELADQVHGFLYDIKTGLLSPVV
ncbi:carbonic anhydrase [Coniochaeta sp. 2T2.1]|nr:carbonic anhydrase [Coniochaeta sp. 2T2.1]